MEKKKLLLVAISVGIFLVIAIVAAIVFAPKSAAAPAAALTRGSGPSNITVPPPPGYQPPLAGSNAPAAGTGTSQPASVDAVDLVRKPGDVPGLKPAPQGTMRQGDGFYVSGTAQPGSARSSETLINVPKPSTAAVPDAPPAVKAAPDAVPAAPKPVAAPKPAVQAKPQSKAPVQRKVYNDFWVQTGAFSTVAKAEGVKETLAAKGITSIIENRDINGKTLFRVRVGPYTSQNEADYWLSLIKSMGGFEGSQVRQTRTQR